MREMRKIILAAVMLALPVSAEAQTGRFEEGNPWYEGFAATCRDGSDMAPECQQGVLQAYQFVSGSQEVTCNFAKFWEVSDRLMDSETFPVLPWQYGVEAVIAEPGVCTSY